VDECLRMRPDVLVVSHPQSARIAADRTRTIPIVFMNAWGLGHEKLIASHARPGGNVTGVAIMNLGAALDGKRTALLKAAAPAVTKVGILWHREAGGLQDIALDDRWPRQARTLALSYVSLPFEDVSNLESVIGEAVKQGVNGLIVGSLSSMIWPDFQRRLHAIVERHRLPAMHELLSAAETGGLMAYAPDFDDNIRRSTYLVDKILRGAKPGDLPVEQPSQLRLYLNVKAARAIGLAFSPSLLAQADRVIE
jgi:putative ABC transport system substrate-binding protein